MEFASDRYPRPQLYREESSWTDLNGDWDFRSDDEKRGIGEGWHRGFRSQRQIRVPFAPETALSGIEDPSVHSLVWYHRSITLTAGQLQGRLLLHLEGSDYHTVVYLNGQRMGEHIGGYARFTCDLTEAAVEGENQLVIRVADSLDASQPRGKQRWRKDNFGCWYVQTTGIWKTVWLESVPEVYIRALKLTPDVRGQKLRAEYFLSAPLSGSLRFTASFEDQVVSRVTVRTNGLRGWAELPLRNVELDEWGLQLWSPEHPALYHLTAELTPDSGREDRVNSYFGMREIRVEGNQIYLNDRPLYQKLILDQGYWEKSHLTPPDLDAILTDLRMIRELGYNGLRKHQKIEDDRFYSWCDRLGLLVWCEMPSAYAYDDDMVEALCRQWTEIVRQHYNHPSVITWTPINESWGIPTVKTDPMQQSLSRTMYYLTHSLDSTRPVISNDGWEHTVSDVVTIHDYDGDGASIRRRYEKHLADYLGSRASFNDYKTLYAENCGYEGQPVLISEYGGIALVNDGTGWGYGDKVEGEEAFLRRFEETQRAILSIANCVGFCYTQLTDVQQEVNGLLHEDRTPKIPVEKIRAINDLMPEI